MSALLSAAVGGHVECVKLLVSHKCDVNIANPVCIMYVLSGIRICLVYMRMHILTMYVCLTILDTKRERRPFLEESFCMVE